MILTYIRLKMKLINATKVLLNGLSKRKTLNIKWVLIMLVYSSSPQKAAHLSEYDTFFIDLVGVVYDGVTYYPHAIQAVNTLVDQGKEVIFVSNNPRPSSLSKHKLLKAGIKQPFKVITSGDYTRHLLITEYAHYKTYHLGGDKNTDISEGISLEEVKTVEECDIVLLSMFIEENIDPTLFQQLQAIAQSKKLVLCPNPDFYAIHGKEIRKCAGYFTDLIEKWKGNVRIVGKPYLDFYNYVIATVLERPFNPKKTLMIGDTLETDILGAQQLGIESLLVDTGISGLGISSGSSAEVIPTMRAKRFEI